MQAAIFRQCQQLFPAWAQCAMDDFQFDAPKGFSSFTMGIRARKEVQPDAVLYRRLAGKENAILDYETEKALFLLLGAHDIAAHCHYYDESCRIEAFYHGRTLRAADLFEPANLRQIANALYRLHQLRPEGLPQRGFFELIHEAWGRLARHVLEERSDAFPPEEQRLCVDLREIYAPQTRAKVQRCLPAGALTFCHNDTYHGNIMKLDSGEIRLLDFEFSCLNHKAYDFSNLFAETVMRHQQPDYPYFKIAEPAYGDAELSMLINFYLDNATFTDPEAREAEFRRLLRDTRDLLILSDYKYALAALPLALAPIQKIRFLPYAQQRFARFQRAYRQRFGAL